MNKPRIYADYLCMKYIFDGSIIAISVLALFFALQSNYLSYYNCMSQTKSSHITKSGSDHVSAQCKAFILEKIMVK